MGSWGPRGQSSLLYIEYCRVDRHRTGASRPRGGSAGFRKFSGEKSCIVRTWRARAGLTVYPPRIQIADVAASLARRDHRKSKFGLRHRIKLIELDLVLNLATAVVVRGLATSRSIHPGACRCTKFSTKFSTQF